MKKIGKEFTFKVNEDFGQTTLGCVLEQLGYCRVDPCFGKDMFRKDNKKYKMIKVNHFNGYVYDITLQEIEDN